MHYYIGLDNGGTTTKAALFSSTGEEIAVCSMSTAMLTPQPDYVERDMEEMWQANCAVIRGVLEQSGVAPKDVACVGICGHGKGLYLWGKDGQARAPGVIISSDNRAWEYPVQLEAGWHRGSRVRPFLPAYHGLSAGRAAGVDPRSRAGRAGKCAVGLRL